MAICGICSDPDAFVSGSSGPSYTSTHFVPLCLLRSYGPKRNNVPACQHSCSRLARIDRSICSYHPLSVQFCLCVRHAAVSEDRGITWTPANLDPELPQREDWLKNEWRESMILGHIPQVQRPLSPPRCVCFTLKGSQDRSHDVDSFLSLQLTVRVDAVMHDMHDMR